jgi:RHS repeat-associated protein
VYDALGRRAAKTVAAVTTRYVHDGWQVVQELLGAADVRSYAYGNYIDEPLCMVTTTASATDTAYYLQGNNYNVVALTGAQREVVEWYAVEPFGTTVVCTGIGRDAKWFTDDDSEAGIGANMDRCVFQGRPSDSSTKLYAFRFRLYGPEVGRAISRDPYRSGPDAHNPYRYLLNSPFDHLDPYGLSAVSALGKAAMYGSFAAIVEAGGLGDQAAALLLHWFNGEGRSLNLSEDWVERSGCKPALFTSRDFESAIRANCKGSSGTRRFEWAGNVRGGGCGATGLLGNFTAEVEVDVECDACEWTAEGIARYTDKYDFNIELLNLAPDFLVEGYRTAKTELKVILMRAFQLITGMGTDFDITTDWVEFYNAGKITQ